MGYVESAKSVHINKVKREVNDAFLVGQPINDFKTNDVCLPTNTSTLPMCIKSTLKIKTLKLMHIHQGSHSLRELQYKFNIFPHVSLNSGQPLPNNLEGIIPCGKYLKGLFTKLVFKRVVFDPGGWVENYNDNKGVAFPNKGVSFPKLFFRIFITEYT